MYRFAFTDINGVLASSRYIEDIKMEYRNILLIMVLITIPAVVQAADKNMQTLAAKEREIFLQTHARGIGISSNSVDYQILPGVRAAHKLAHEQPEHTSLRMSGTKLIETKGSFVVFEAAEQSQSSVTLVNGANSLPTVINVGTGGIGIIPGTIRVKLKNSSSGNAVATDHGLEVVRIFEHLKTAFYQVKSGQDVVAVTTSLNSDTRVESAELEVIEHVLVPH